MISFKTMWEDVSGLVDSGEVKELDIIEKFNCGFTIRVNDDDVEFVTKDDFIDFWGRMLYFHEICPDQVWGKDHSKEKYIYSLVRRLPYIDEVSGVLKLNQ